MIKNSIFSFKKFRNYEDFRKNDNINNNNKSNDILQIIYLSVFI